MGRDSTLINTDHITMQKHSNWSLRSQFFIIEKIFVLKSPINAKKTQLPLKSLKIPNFYFKSLNCQKNSWSSIFLYKNEQHWHLKMIILLWKSTWVFFKKKCIYFLKITIKNARLMQYKYTLINFKLQFGTSWGAMFTLFFSEFFL